MLTLEVRQALAGRRRDLYGLLSSAYIHIPEEKTLELRWDPAIKLLGYPHPGGKDALHQIEEGLNLIKPYDSGGRGLDEQVLTGLSRDWTRLFRGTDREVLPPYESLYRPGNVPRKPAQEVHRLFSDRGIQVPDEWRQPPDYIGVELDFMRLLCSKESDAYEKQEKDAIVDAVKAEKSFIEHHLASWVSTYCVRMTDQAREDYYRGVARLTMGLIEYDRIYVNSLLGAGNSPESK